MEQALVDALKQFGPAAIVIGVPCVLVIRALWIDNKALRTALTNDVRDIALKSIEANIEQRHVIEKLVERFPQKGAA